jgi:hypothetical protein
VENRFPIVLTSPSKNAREVVIPGYIFMLRARNILITSFIIDSTDVIYTENMLHGRHSVISINDVVGVMATDMAL